MSDKYSISLMDLALKFNDFKWAKELLEGNATKNIQELADLLYELRLREEKDFISYKTFQEYSFTDISSDDASDIIDILIKSKLICYWSCCRPNGFYIYMKNNTQKKSLGLISSKPVKPPVEMIADKLFELAKEHKQITKSDDPIYVSIKYLSQITGINITPEMKQTIEGYLKRQKYIDNVWYNWFNHLDFPEGFYIKLRESNEVELKEIVNIVLKEIEQIRNNFSSAELSTLLFIPLKFDTQTLIDAGEIIIQNFKVNICVGTVHNENGYYISMYDVFKIF